MFKYLYRLFAVFLIFAFFGALFLLFFPFYAFVFSVCDVISSQVSVILTSIQLKHNELVAIDLLFHHF